MKMFFKLQIPAQISPQEQAILVQLEEIYLPNPVGLWPPSIGLLCLIILLFLAVTFSAFLLYRRYTMNRYRKVAMSKLQVILNTKDTLNHNELFHRVNTLIKQCCLTAIPCQKTKIARVWGDNFYNFIIKTSKTNQNHEQLIAHQSAWTSLSYSQTHYSTTNNVLTDDEHQHATRHYIDLVKSWIKHHNKQAMIQILESNRFDSRPKKQ